MKRPVRTIRTRFCALLCLACILLGTVSSAFSEENGTSVITGSFASLGHTVFWDYQYSADFFRQPSDEYSHDLAKLSLGMALAAFRDEENPENQDNHLISFFQTLGFDQIETDPFHTAPITDSICYGIARMRLEEMTVVAVAVCGGGYGAEWASNLTVGDGVRSYGFQDASQKVQAALKDYLERNVSQGPVSLWISGFSRAGAVSNITAADCTDSGIFKNVYAYTFATPRTTREPGDYRNIFNILQKNDLVPKVPLADWGYKRYGTDMFLVSPEIDMDREAVIERSKALYRKMTGSEMVCNFEINYQLRILVDYLYMLLQDSAAYTAYLQPLILDIMTQNEGTQDALLILLEALQRYSLEDDKHGDELKALRDYLGTLVNIYYLQDGISKLPAEQWDPALSMVNLFNDHLPFEYLALLSASDDPRQVFSEDTRYIRLVIYGNVEAEIKNGGRTLKTVLANGKEMVDGVEAPLSLPDVNCSKEKMVITLPADQSFTISVTSKSFLPQTITYTGLLFSGDTVRAQADDVYSFLMYRGDTASIITSANGKAIEPEGSDHTDVSGYISTIYSPTTAMRLENNSVIHLTISGFVNKILFIVLLLLVSLIVSVILAVIRKKKHRERNDVMALIWHSVIAAVFALLEVAMWYFVPILTIAKFITGFLVTIVIAVYAVKGYRTDKKRLKPCLILIGALVAYVILESLLIGDFTLPKGILLLTVYACFIFAAYELLWKDHSKKRLEKADTAVSQ